MKRVGKKKDWGGAVTKSPEKYNFDVLGTSPVNSEIEEIIDKVRNRYPEADPKNVSDVVHFFYCGSMTFDQVVDACSAAIENNITTSDLRIIEDVDNAGFDSATRNGITVILTNDSIQIHGKDGSKSVVGEQKEVVIESIHPTEEEYRGIGVQTDTTTAGAMVDSGTTMSGSVNEVNLEITNETQPVDAEAWEKMRGSIEEKINRND